MSLCVLCCQHISAKITQATRNSKETLKPMQFTAINRTGPVPGAQTVGRKTSWAKDVWANYFLGDTQLGDKLGRYGDSKSDGWATFSDGWAKCVKEEKLKTSDTTVGLKIEIHEIHDIHEIHQYLRNPVFINLY